MADVVLKDQGLQKLIKAFKGPAPEGRIGILGGAKMQREEMEWHEKHRKYVPAVTGKAFKPENWKSGALGVGTTNAEVGAAHEYGAPSKKIPQRSFLRMPLTLMLNTRLQQSNAFQPAVLSLVVKKGDLRPWLSKVMITAEAVVAEAFDTAGFGQWTPSNMDKKKVKQTLVETQQLRESITSEVK